MTLNPYQSPTIAGQPHAEVTSSFRRRYWFELLMVGQVVLVLTVTMLHWSLRGIREWYHYPPVVLFVACCWFTAPVLFIGACIRATLRVSAKKPWATIATILFCFVVLPGNAMAEWINPEIQSMSVNALANLINHLWPKGIPFP